MADPIQGFSGLVAGCGLAVHMLKAYFEDLGKAMLHAAIRIYLDDITLTVRSMATHLAVRRMSKDLAICQAGLAAKQQVNNKAK